MLYPKEEKIHSNAYPVLLHYCKNCEHQEEAENPCVYQNNIIPVPIERKHAVQGLASDPALPRTHRTRCPKCGHNEAVFFQTQDRRKDTPLTLNFVCANTTCNHLWVPQSTTTSTQATTNSRL